MRILHYSLGFPPYRSGGLTKFSMDLMKAQRMAGHEIALLWPGTMRMLFRKVSVKDRGITEGIRSFEVVNPLPVPYDEGICDLAEFMKEPSMEVYETFLENFSPDILHVHTFMGMHKALLETAKRRNIRIVFTSHDFFPICPKVTLYRDEGVCTNALTCENCGVCNRTALSLTKIRILQSPVYRRLKNTGFMKKLRKNHRDNFLSYSAEEPKPFVDFKTGATAADYQSLRNYYKEMLLLADTIHYNSRLTKEIYEGFFGKMNNRVISISHLDIADHRHRRGYTDSTLRVRYLGPYAKSKGFMELYEAVKQADKRISLDVHFEMTAKSDFVNCHGKYDYSMLGEIFDDTDVLVVPSVWCETFGYTALEALSYGVPVIMSDHVGAKDILADGAGMIYRTREELVHVLEGLDARELSKMNEVICDRQRIISMEDVARSIEQMCYLP